MNLTPKQIVSELDKYIIGQDKAKRAVAVALRNRYRRSKLQKSLQEEITPKNIIMKGPTGVGKTEIARRLAKLVKAPFIKIEATKYTEVGYVGRDVESMIRDLVEASVRLVKDEKYAEVVEKVKPTVDKRLFDLLYPIKKATTDVVIDENGQEYKDYIMENLKNNKYDDEVVEIEVKDTPKSFEMMPGAAAMEINLEDMLGGFFPSKKKKRKLTIKQAREILNQEECEKIVDMDSVKTEAIRRAEEEGIIFIDEIDKIAGSSGRNNGPEVSREGVQRDILPIVEGCTVNTKHGNVKTDYILFIAAGAFHIASVSDLIPELQGRFPVKVELQSLTKKDFVEILTKPDNAILMQYTELLKVDNVRLKFTKEAIEEIAEVAYAQNESDEDIGARRLQTIMEKLLEDVSYELGASGDDEEVVVDKKYVDDRLGAQLQSLNLNKFIL